MLARAPINYTIASFFYLAVFVANRFVFASPLIGVILLGLFFALFGRQLGAWCVRNLSVWWQTAIGSVLLLSALMVAGTTLYYVAFLPEELWVVLVLLTPVAVWLLHPHYPASLSEFWKSRPHAVARPLLLSVAAGIAFLVGLFLLVGNVEILDAVRSPWERVPLVVFWLFGLLALILSTLCFYGRSRALTFPLVVTSLFLVLAVAILVYPLGFGFDSFLHRATESHIAQFGSIDPKPLYYIGQYVLVLFTSSAFSLSLPLVDRLLVPVLAALLIPAAWYFASGTLGKNKRGSFFSLIGVFLLPLSGWIVTTPQGLANLWTLLLILLSLPYLSTREGLGLRPLALLTAAALAIHPLAGIPALLYLALVIAHVHSSKKVLWLVALGGSVSLPIIFAINSAISGLPMRFDLSAVSPLSWLDSMRLNLVFQSGYDILLDVVYLFSANHLLLFLLIGGWMLWSLRHAMPASLRLPAIMAGVMLINYLFLSSAVEFSFLIDYERSNYANRLLVLVFFFLAPYLLLFLSRTWERVANGPVVSRAFLCIIVASLLTSQFYLTYPRRDNYETSHGFNTSVADVAAVEYIHENAPTDYLVLSNQQVAAAAVERYGFLRYYDDAFYYPIPTGGEMYQKFLAMNERPTREIMLEAMQKASVYTAYYVVDNYWWEAPRIIETAKTNADEWIALREGAVHVFRYNRLDR
ncbi:hypothetical protein HYW18_04105 [Candidatus Uhrbacteria bacterium]|nr:hypothetical protein [Candidatus Uhrbacteria bacterium]